MSAEEFLNPSVKKLGKSLLWEFFDLASNTENVISLSVGEPDFKTPWHISEEGIYAIEKGRTYYPPTRGLEQLRKGIAKYYKRRLGVTGYTNENILVTNGASESIDLICRTILSEGDECIILDPGYVAYEPSVLLTGAKPVYLCLKEENAFKVTKEELEECITDKTKMIILNYPSNPTGGIMTKEDYEEIVPILKKHHILTVCDEIYIELTYGEEPFSLANIEDFREQLVIVNGFSKAYSMTGWRLGYMIADKTIIEACNSIHQYSVMGASTISQFAGVEAVSEKGDKNIDEHKESFEARRNFIVNRLNKMGLYTPMPKGAFYVFPNISSTGLSSYDFCVKLLQEEKVCVIPGTAFGPSGEGHVRISYAYSLEELKLALEKIEHFLENLKK